ncbi:MAG: hypothetical protein AAGG01_21225 [Planctomycetota bacterium]
MGGAGALPQPNQLVPAVAGATWHFQLWHRDTNPAGMASSNFTDALRVLFR